MRKPPRGKWKLGDIATFGGLYGRIIALNSPNVPGYPLCWVTSEPYDHYPDNKSGMLVRFDSEGKFQSWHRAPLLSFVRRATQLELIQLKAKMHRPVSLDSDTGNITEVKEDAHEPAGS